MNIAEFNKWSEFHCGCFPDFGDSLAKSLADPNVARAWQAALVSVPYDDACEATRRMLGDSKLQPNGWSKHPAAIKDIALAIWSERSAKGAKRKYIDGQEVFNCYHCRDTGTVTILAPRFVEAVRRGLIEREPFDVPATSKMAKCDNWRWGRFFSKRAKAANQIVQATTFVVACCCKLGKPENFNGATLDPDEHYTGDVPVTAAEVEQFEAHVQRLGELQPANYRHEFDAFNNG